MTNLMSQKMGIHEWSYDNDTSNDLRYKVPWAKAETALASIRVEVELGFDAATAFKEAQRCLNCDVQTVFNGPPASSATPASTSARWTASASSTTATKPSCAAPEGAGAEPRAGRCTCPAGSRPAA
jgi:hypothetical protein